MQRKMHMKINSGNIFSDKNIKEQSELNILVVQLNQIVIKVNDLN
jgi:hypothetical protein